MPDRISTLDPGYQPGDLSVFPQAFDDQSTLYQVENYAETTVKQAVPYNAKYIIVNDASSFPPQGIICLGPMRGVTASQTHVYSNVGTKGSLGIQGLFKNTGTPDDIEIVCYGSRTDTVFKDLDRGFAGSRRNAWPVGTYVANTVMAEPHNACKDAIINIEKVVGTTQNTDPNSIYGRLLALENRMLSPQAFFRAYPKQGIPPLTVKFQNACSGIVERYLWDFGDGTVSLDANPTHTYTQEGNYTVSLTIITSTRGTGMLTKKNYISVSTSHAQPFFYAQPVPGPLWLSRKTSTLQGHLPTEILFVDQTPGKINQRYWIFGDGSEPLNVVDPYDHTATHVYEEPGRYSPTLLLTDASNNSTQQAYLPTPVIIL